MPNVFPGESSTPGVFYADESGEFNDPSIWRNQITPYSPAYVIIPRNVVVTLSRDILDLDMTDCDVYGTLVLGSSTSRSFTLNYPANVTIYENGTLQFPSSVREFISPPETLMITFPSGSLVGENVTITTSSNSRALARTDSRAFFGGNKRGPYTSCGLSGGSTFGDDSVANLPRRSGEFTDSNSWFGRKAPSSNVCERAGGCSLQIVTSVSLSTASLNGNLDIRFNIVVVSIISTLQIGTPGFGGGFRFRFEVQLNIFGILAEVSGTAGGIFVPPGSKLNFFPGASFTSIVATHLYVYDPNTNAILTSITLEVSLTGPFYVSVAISGTISTSTIGNNIYILFPCHKSFLPLF